MRDGEQWRLSKVDVPNQSISRASNVSSTGSPIKPSSKLVKKPVVTASRDVSPISTSKKAMGCLPSPPCTPNSAHTEVKRHSTSCATTNAPNTLIAPDSSVESVASIVVAKRGQSVPQLRKDWSPQRIVTPQKPIVPGNACSMDIAEGHGTFVRPGNPENFRDALGFFEAMSHRKPLYPARGLRKGKRPSDEVRSVSKPPSKREKLKGSLRRMSSSWRFKRTSAIGGAEAPSEYPAMWKLGSVESAPRQRLHAEWCEVSSDHRQPLRSSKAGEISLFDPYLSSHGKAYRGGEHTHGHMDILLQQSSLHDNARCAVESDYGASDVATDFSRSPVHDYPQTLKPPRRSPRRWFSRSSGTLVSQAHCRLEQPRPVYGVEMKRLVSLCKLQGSVKRRGHTE